MGRRQRARGRRCHIHTISHARGTKFINSEKMREGAFEQSTVGNSGPVGPPVEKERERKSGRRAYAGESEE